MDASTVAIVDNTADASVGTVIERGCTVVVVVVVGTIFIFIYMAVAIFIVIIVLLNFVIAITAHDAAISDVIHVSHLSQM